MKISIITPSFNQGKYLEQTIISVLNQNYPILEYIIIDGDSTDDSVNIIKTYEKYLTYWTSEKDGGQSDAINKGFRKATGEIIAWLNSDDIYLPNTFSTVSKIFSENPEIDLIYGDVINFNEKNIESNYKVKEFEIYDFISRNSIHQPSVFFRKKLLDTVGLLDETLHYCMDYDLWMRFFFNYKTLKINIPLSKFRVHTKSKTSSNPKKMYLEYRKLISRFFNSFEDQGILKQLNYYGVYENYTNNKYKLPFLTLSLEKLKRIYLHECAIQEYSWGNVNKANRLFLESLQEPSLPLNLFFLLKNNLRIKKIFP